MELESANLKMHTYYKDNDDDYVYIHGTDGDEDNPTFYGIYASDIKKLKVFIETLNVNSLPTEYRYTNHMPETIDNITYDYEDIDVCIENWEEVDMGVQSWKTEMSL